MVAFKAFRLLPGADLFDSICREANRDAPASHAIVTAVGSLTRCRVRLAGATATSSQIVELPGPFEIVALVGTVANNGAHMHIAVSDSEGRVLGGHLMTGSTINTTCEVVLADLRPGGIVLTREADGQTGFRELKVVESK
jgi:predicted DNA-binding protein with PD1-like motif